RLDGREDPAARGVELLVARPRRAQRELLDAIPGETRVGVTVHQPRDRAQAAPVELDDVSRYGAELGHRTAGGNHAVLAEKEGALHDLDLSKIGAPKGCVASRGCGELRQIADEQASRPARGRA